MDYPPIILGSGSAIRRDILQRAGLAFSTVKPGVDESEIKAACRIRGQTLEETAMALASAKALAVEAADDAFVIGADQILELDGEGFDKPLSMAEARDRLIQLSGRQHRLINAVTVARRGVIDYRQLETPVLIMRDLTPDEIDAYLETAGPDILSSVGAYQVEALGMRLFSRIDGDYYAVLGLSIYPLLAYFRANKAIPF